MKGTSFQNGIEFKIHIDGESWSQGDTLSGTLDAVIRNPGSQPPPLHVLLVDGTEKKIKAKSDDAFQVLEKAETKQGPLEWKFNLPLDARISDKAGSLYILYGASETLSAQGQLRLNIIPQLHLREILEVLNVHFRFVLKSMSMGKKGWMDLKLDPPDTKDWVSLEQLVLSLKRDEQTISVKFSFHRNEIDSGKPGFSTQKVKRELAREWEVQKLIHSFNQRLDKDAATAAIDQVIAEYHSAGWLNS